MLSPENTWECDTVFATQCANNVLEKNVYKDNMLLVKALGTHEGLGKEVILKVEQPHSREGDSSWP